MPNKRSLGYMVAGIILIGLGLLNIYPFLWMTGTSLKSNSEANLHRAQPLPAQKYHLTEAGREYAKNLPSTSQLDMLALLQSRYGRQLAQGQVLQAQTYNTIAYANQVAVELPQARREIADLVQRGWLQRSATNAPTVADDELAYELAPGGRAALLDGFNARQLSVLRLLRELDSKLIETYGQARFVASRLTAEEYARKVELLQVGLRDAAAAQGQPDVAGGTEELLNLIERGYLQRSAFMWENYLVVLRDMRFYVNLITSLALTAGVVVLMVLVSSMLGYALARVSFPGKFLVIALMLIGSIAPGEARIIPIFRLIQGAGLLDGLWGMTLWLVGAGIGNALLMAGFFMTLPKEVEEAATMDGAGPFTTFFDIALPMARPIVMTVALFAFLGAWNDFMIPFLCTQANPALQPLAVAVYMFQQGNTGFLSLTNAAAAIMIVPVIILFLALQKHIVSAIAVGAVKG